MHVAGRHGYGADGHGDIWLHGLRGLRWPEILMYMHMCNELQWHGSKLVTNMIAH